MSDDPEIHLSNPSRYGEVRLRALRRWLEALVADLAPGSGGLGVRFTSDRQIRELNKRYRQRDSATDVLSFPGEESPDGRYLGDVVISVPTAARQAAVAGHSCQTELQLLMLHGVLHCLGYDHEVDDGAMEREEDRLRDLWVEGWAS